MYIANMRYQVRLRAVSNLEERKKEREKYKRKRQTRKTRAAREALPSKKRE